MALDKRVAKFRKGKSALSDKPKRVKKGRKRSTIERFMIQNGAM